MRAQALALTLSLATLANNAYSQGFGQSEQLRKWQFHLESETTTEDWRPVSVPHDWSVEYPANPDNASCTGYLPGGIGWYQTEITLPPENADKRSYLYFEGVYNRSEVFVNGNPVGSRPNGYVSFLYDITPFAKPGQTNLVTVRVDHSLSADSRWYTGSGIYRPVHLVTANPVHLALWGISYATTTNQNGTSDISVTTRIQNHLPNEATIEISHELIDPDGKTIATKTLPLRSLSHSETSSTSLLSAPDARLWSVDTPNLYTLKTLLNQNGKTIDTTTTRIGIRTLSFDADQGFALNGNQMKIKGVCLHHDAGVLGSAVPKEVWRQRLLKLKEIGCNGIRMSHNPQATALYDLCDELGFLVMDEAFDEWEYPKKKWLEGWNKGTPGFQGPADFFQQWAERDLADMVKRDRNHPSIILWSIGNEVDYPNDPYSHPILDQEGIGQQHTAGYQKDQPPAERLGAIAKRLAAVVRQHDTSRPVTAALAGAIMSNETDYPSALDVVGYNYTENRYAQDHAAYPDRVLYGSETRHDLAAWNAVAKNDFIFGQFIWTGFDYLGEAGAWPSRGFTTGMIDLANNIKPRGYFRRALWAEKPVATLGTYLAKPNPHPLSIDAQPSWNYQYGQTIKVVCYTNGDEAELFLNGKSVGPPKPFDPQTAIIAWEVPYQAGELKVVSYQNGKPVAADSIKTDGKATAIKAEKTGSYLENQYDVAVIPLSVVDAQGELVYHSAHQVQCSVAGPGKLLGLENASHDASENHRDNQAGASHGRLVAYVQATAASGTIEVTFTAPGLETCALQLPIGN